MKKIATVPAKRRNLVRAVRGFIFSLMFLGLILPLIGCAPKLYHVDMRYEPTKEIPPTVTDGRKYSLTVASFIDRRKMDDTLLIGRVIRSDGTPIPILPQYVKAKDAVTAALRELLFKTGYKVSPDKPAWDLSENAIRPEWGTLLIGGTIDELDVTCVESFTMKRYTAKARLSFSFADVQRKRIFYRVTSESSSSLTHAFLSEQRLENEINAVLSSALEKVIEDGETGRRIREALKPSSNGLGLFPPEELDLEELRPELSRYKEAVPAGIVGDPVEYIHGGPPVGAGEQPLQIDPAGYGAGYGRNLRDPIRPVDIGINLAPDELQFVQTGQRHPPAVHIQPSRFPEGFRIQKPQRRGAVAHDQPVPIASQTPSLSRIAEGSAELQTQTVVNKPQIRSPGQLQQPAAPLGDPLPEILTVQKMPFDYFPRLQADLPQARCPVQPGALIKISVTPDEPLRKCATVVGIDLDDAVSINGEVGLISSHRGRSGFRKGQARNQADPCRHQEREEGSGFYGMLKETSPFHDRAHQ